MRRACTPTWWRDNQAIIIAETIDAIRTLTGPKGEGRASIAKSDAALGIGMAYRHKSERGAT